MANTKGVRVANMTPDNFNATIRALEGDYPPPESISFNIGMKIDDMNEIDYAAFLEQVNDLCDEYEVDVSLNVTSKVKDISDMDYPNFYRMLTELCARSDINMSVGVSGKFEGNTLLHPNTGQESEEAGEDG